MDMSCGEVRKALRKCPTVMSGRAGLSPTYRRIHVEYNAIYYNIEDIYFMGLMYNILSHAIVLYARLAPGPGHFCGSCPSYGLPLRVSSNRTLNNYHHCFGAH